MGWDWGNGNAADDDDDEAMLVSAVVFSKSLPISDDPDPNVIVVTGAKS